MRHYHRKNWQNFRREVIELDGGICVSCKRGPLEGAVLQIHHKRYLPGKLPWEYPYDLCQTLCKRCHAGEHGIIRPFSGWECIGYDDLEELNGECELCGNSIRYVFYVQHEKWPTLEVGETCCDHLTGNTEASVYRDSLDSLNSRRKRFVHSIRWEIIPKGNQKIRQRGIEITIERFGLKFVIRANEIRGKRLYPSVTDAKAFAFDQLEGGLLEAYLKRRNERSR
jgi:hypothetical protein